MTVDLNASMSVNTIEKKLKGINLFSFYHKLIIEIKEYELLKKCFRINPIF